MTDHFPSCPVRFESSALCAAAVSGRSVDIVTATVLHDPNEFEAEWCPLFVAAFHGNLEALVTLVSQGADLFLTRRSDGFTAAHAAAQGNQSRVISLLVAKGGGGLLEKKARGDTPLHLAARLGHHEAIHALVNAGCNPNVRNDISGATPLWLAVERQLIATVQLLVRLGASVHARSTAGVSPLQLAQDRSYTSMQTVLVELGADKPAAERTAASPSCMSSLAATVTSSPVPSTQNSAGGSGAGSRSRASTAMLVRSSLTGLPSGTSPKTIVPPATPVPGTMSRESTSGSVSPTGGTPGPMLFSTSAPPPTSAAPARDSVASALASGSPVMGSKVSPAIQSMNTAQLRTERERLESQLKEVEQARTTDYVRMKEVIQVEIKDLQAMEPRLNDNALAAVRQRQAGLVTAQTYVGPSVLAAFDSRMNALERQLAKQNEEREKLLDALARVHQEKRGLAAELGHIRNEFLRSYQEKEALLKEIVDLKQALSRARTQSTAM